MRPQNDCTYADVAMNSTNVTMNEVEWTWNKDLCFGHASGTIFISCGLTVKNY